MTPTVSIFHRIDKPYDEIRGATGFPTLALAYTFEIPYGDTRDPDQLLEDVFDACGNCPQHMDRGWYGVQALHRLKRRRSLSVGDVVQLPDGRCFTVDRAGFRQVPRGLVANPGRFTVPYPTFAATDASAPRI